MVEEKNELNIDNLESIGEVLDETSDAFDESNDFNDYYSNLVESLLKKREPF